MKYKRGDIALVLFPDSNLQTAKRRPVLVLQADNLDTRLNQTIVAMVTSSLIRANHPSRVSDILSTPEGKASGLLLDSVIMTDNIVTISHLAFDRKIGVWKNMSEVETALRHTLDI